MAIESKECFAALTEDGQLWEIYQAAQSGGGGGGAPTNASYVVISNDPTLTNERVLTQGSNITITDGGANNPVTVATVVDPTFDSVQIDTTPTAPVTPAVGKLAWNDTDGTLEFGLKGGNVNLQVGQENVILVKNDEASPLTAGEVVYISGANGVNLLVKRAKADADATSASTIGIVSEAIAINGQGFITTFGVVKNVNTNAFNDGDILYLSPTTAGAITNVKPSAPDHLVLVGFVQKKSAGAGEIFVEIQNGYELDELHNVQINSGTLANNDLLAYNSATQTWQNKTASGAGVVGGSVGAVDNSVLRADVGTGIVQNSGIIIDDVATATQDNVAIRNNSAATNSAIVLTPKGTGAFILGPKPDGTATGGNARGSRAIDLQTSRNLATQVSSGAKSFIGGGERNTAAAENNVVCGGYGNTSNGGSVDLPAAIVGGGGNSATNVAVFIGGGNNNIASGQESSICGGRLNTSSSNGTFVGGGYAHTASATGAVVAGGGERSGSVGGNGNIANTALSAILGGARTLADRYGMQAHANGAFASGTTSGVGDAQRARFVLRCKTTTNAAVQMALDGGTIYLGIPSGKVIACTINISGVKSDGSAVAHYIRQYAVKNVGGTSSEVYAPVTIGTDNAAGTVIALSANNADDTLRIAVTGIAAETWRWVASVDAVEIAYGT